jgi:phosphatidylserine decarboxylase
VFLLSFFRDPPRTIPDEPDALVSPADGTITHVEEVDDPAFPEGKALRVSIFLSVFNVHVNRIPRPGRIVGLAYYPGEYLDARSEGCAVRNEQLWVDMEDAETRGLVRIKQIAGAIARRIVCVLRSGEVVRAGDRFGMIKFGSRTDVLVPPALVREVPVRVGDKVRGGSTVLMRLSRPEG